MRASACRPGRCSACSADAEELLRLAVYTDYAYRRDGEAVFAERAFVLFLAELARRVDRLVLLGRLHPESGRSTRSHYRVADEIEFLPLPHYESLARPLDGLAAAARSVRAFWRGLDNVDVVWLLGPHPLCLVFALLALARGRRVVLGVRQDLPLYARTRHPGRRTIQLAADALEWSYRLLARICPTIVVGPDLARRYGSARRLLALNVSLVRAADVPAEVPSRKETGPFAVLSVGRLETEKNPLLLADIAARLSGGANRWRLVVCGEGPLEEPLRARAAELGAEQVLELRGYVPLDEGLLDLYRDCRALLHVSWTEGVPQILFEAFATGLPVVATAVGGVPDAVGDDALVIPAGDADAAAAALERLAADAQLRRRLAEGGLERVRERTLEAESERVADFLDGASRRPSNGAARTPT